MTEHQDPVPEYQPGISWIRDIPTGKLTKVLPNRENQLEKRQIIDGNTHIGGDQGHKCTIFVQSEMNEINMLGAKQPEWGTSMFTSVQDMDRDPRPVDGTGCR